MFSSMYVSNCDDDTCIARCSFRVDFLLYAGRLSFSCRRSFGYLQSLQDSPLAVLLLLAKIHAIRLSQRSQAMASFVTSFQDGTVFLMLWQTFSR